MEETQDKVEEEPRVIRDFAILIGRLREQITSAPDSAKKTEWNIDPESAKKELESLGWSEPGKGRSSIVPSERTAVELGPPAMPSFDIIMTTAKTEIINDGTVTLLGEDLQDLSGGKAGFMQAVLLLLDEDANRLAMENKRFLFNRLPGYMVRSVPGRLWVRVDRELMDKEFSFYNLGCALYTAFKSETEDVKACEIVFAAGDTDMVGRFEAVSKQANALARDNRKLQVDPDGTYSCEDLDCDDCDEQPYCDDIRDLIKYRRKKKPE